MFAKKHLLGLRDIKKDEIESILDTATEMKKFIMQDHKRTPHLQGKSILTLFYENSTRTRLSFELACKYMSAASANISAATSSVSKGETLLDTGRTLDRMGADIIIMRHPMAGAPHMLSKYTKAGIINAGDGMNEHPTQALLDIFTMREKFGSLSGLNVAIVGDVLHSRVARSNIWGLKIMGANVSIAAPTTLLPKNIERMGVKISNHPNEILRGADVVMGLRIQKERQTSGLLPSLREYYREFGIGEERLALAKEHVMLMHPGPVNRGVELSSSVIDSANSVIDSQVTNGVAIRMALLFLMTRRSV